MSRTWTPEQRAAFSRRNRNILVSAAAGSGKTAVLVERIIRYLVDETDPVDIDRLLVVTFTNAAAHEMKERIGKALAKRLTEEPHNKHIERQLLLLGKASISTLHAFCLDIIRQNYYLLKLPHNLSLDPAFRIADEIEAALLKQEVLDEVLEECYGEEDPVFLQVVESFGGERDDSKLQDLILKIYNFSRSQAEPYLWLDTAADVFQANLEDQRVNILFYNMAASITTALEEALTKLQRAEGLAKLPGGPYIYQQNLREEILQLEEAIALLEKPASSGYWTAVYQVLREIKFGRLKACRGEIDEKLKAEAQDFRNEAKKIVQKIQQEFLARKPEELLQDMQEMAPLMAALCQLVAHFSKAFLAAKLERNILDFSDIEHFTLNLLRVQEEGKWYPTDLALKLKQRYKEVLLDEYQDINNVQETILKLVSREDSLDPNLFMVGDVKQSIYGFRLADPRLFLQKYQKYSKDSPQDEKIVLSRNFRSRENIIHGVNYVFRQVMMDKAGGLAYDSDAELVYGAAYPALPEEEEALAGPIEVHIVEKASKEEIGEEEKEEEDKPFEPKEDLDLLQMEAKIVGERIQELLGRKVWDKDTGEFRAIHYRDIVILLRSTKTAAPLFLEELRQLAIPAYADSGTGYFDAQEVQTVLALLKVIDNPRQDIPLTAVLCSPLVELTPEELANIRLQRPQGDFYNAVRLAARRETGKLKKILRTFLKDLHYWRTFARRHSLVDLIWLIYRETNFYSYVGALPGGKQRQANLRFLLERAKQYEATNMKGLFKFLRFLEKLQDSNNDLGAARALGENEDVVRIMSIHKSKGLEFPVVFLAGLGKGFNMKDINEEILIDRDLGLGPMWVDSEHRLKYPTLAKLAIKSKLKREMIAEEIRILYVAMTRAQEKLIMVGGVKQLGKKANNWSNLLFHSPWELPLNIVRGAKSLGDWIGPCLMRHPTGKKLRSLANLAEQQETGFNLFQEDKSQWHIYFWNQGSLPGQDQDRENSYQEQLSRIKNFLPVEEEEQGAEAVQRLRWQYSYQFLADIPAKLSVTEIKNRYQLLAQDEFSNNTTYTYERHFAARPQFLQEESGLSASERGSAFHLVMRHLELSSEMTEDNINRQIKAMIDKEIISPVQGKVVDALAIVQFFQSSVGSRMLKSPQVIREIPFTLEFPAGELYPERQELKEDLLLQGTIDCLFAEEDGLVLLDYKTDLVTKDTLDLLKLRYQVQMDLYSRAVETILQKPVKDKYFYSFAVGEAIPL